MHGPLNVENNLLIVFIQTQLQVSATSTKCQSKVKYRASTFTCSEYSHLPGTGSNPEPNEHFH